MIENGVHFDDIHSFFDMHLILSKTDIPPAKPKTSFVDLPGGDSALDLTEAHGEIRYYDREGSLTFTVSPGDEMTFEERKSQVSDLLNGKTFERIILDKDPEYYYSGRCIVNEYLQDKNIKQIVVSVKLKPYKMKCDETAVMFHLTETPQTVRLKNSRRSVVPTILCTNDNAVVTFSDHTFTLSAGAHNILDIYFTEGDNIVQIAGSGTMTFVYREGKL